MAKDRVQPLKMESIVSGGDSEDDYPTSLDRNHDFIDGRGVVIQNHSSNDDAVAVARDEFDNMTFEDVANPTPVTLSSLIAGAGGLTIEGHKILRQLIHFIDEGPAEGFASGAYKEVTGTVFPTAIIWYDKAGVGKKKIVEKLITWTGPKATAVVWKMYDAAETRVAMISDAINYSGVFETDRTRTITVP